MVRPARFERATYRFVVTGSEKQINDLLVMQGLGVHRSCISIRLMAAEVQVKDVAHCPGRPLSPDTRLCLVMARHGRAARKVGRPYIVLDDRCDTSNGGPDTSARDG